MFSPDPIIPVKLAKIKSCPSAGRKDKQHGLINGWKF